jgi:hypothetical protein
MRDLWGTHVSFCYGLLAGVTKKGLDCPRRASLAQRQTTLAERHPQRCTKTHLKIGVLCTTTPNQTQLAGCAMPPQRSVQRLRIDFAASVGNIRWKEGTILSVGT